MSTRDERRDRAAGNVPERVMTVAELIAELAKLDPTARVVITWEGVTSGIARKNVYIAANGTVVLDGDGNFYRECFTTGKMTP